MKNIVNITYDQNGQSVSTSDLGMREMQARAYENRTHQYILLKVLIRIFPIFLKNINQT